MDKKNVLCAATNDYLPVEQEQDSGHCHLKLKANIADTKAFYGFK